jgi:hypothetical protein
MKRIIILIALMMMSCMMVTDKGTNYRYMNTDHHVVYPMKVYSIWLDDEFSEGDKEVSIICTGIID